MAISSEAILGQNWCPMMNMDLANLKLSPERGESLYEQLVIALGQSHASQPDAGRRGAGCDLPGAGHTGAGMLSLRRVSPHLRATAQTRFAHDAESRTHRRTAALAARPGGAHRIAAGEHSGG